MSLIGGQSLEDAVKNGGYSAALGFGMGFGGGFYKGWQDAKALNVNPITNKLITNEGVFCVTPEGVVLPKDPKYEIPDNYVESKYNSQMKNSTEYGIIDESGKYIPKIRIDAATPAGTKGPNVSHYHLNGGSKHYTPSQSDPGFKINIKK